MKKVFTLVFVLIGLFATAQVDVSTRNGNPATVIRVADTSGMLSGQNTGIATNTASINTLNQDFTSLTFGNPLTWNTANARFPYAKTTATGSFTIDMTNVKSGSNGMLKLITNTASAVTLSFDADFTNKISNNTVTTYTLPAGTGKEYFLSYVVDGTTIEWFISDGTDASSPTYTAWTPTYSGFSANPGGTARYILQGKLCTVWVTMTSGTSNATTFTMTLPFAASSITTQTGAVAAYDNALFSGIGFIRTRTNSTTADLYKATVGGTWTASSTKAANFSFTYEIE